MGGMSRQSTAKSGSVGSGGSGRLGRRRLIRLRPASQMMRPPAPPPPASRAGCTPAGANIDAWRCAFQRPGVPGDTKENSFNLATPERDQE